MSCAQQTRWRQVSFSCDFKETWRQAIKPMPPWNPLWNLLTFCVCFFFFFPFSCYLIFTLQHLWSLHSEKEVMGAVVKHCGGLDSFLPAKEKSWLRDMATCFEAGRVSGKKERDLRCIPVKKKKSLQTLADGNWQISHACWNSRPFTVRKSEGERGQASRRAVEQAREWERAADSGGTASPSPLLPGECYDSGRKWIVSTRSSFLKEQDNTTVMGGTVTPGPYSENQTNIGQRGSQCVFLIQTSLEKPFIFSAFCFFCARMKPFQAWRWDTLMESHLTGPTLTHWIRLSETCLKYLNWLD